MYISESFGSVLMRLMACFTLQYGGKPGNSSLKILLKLSVMGWSVIFSVVTLLKHISSNLQVLRF